MTQTLKQNYEFRRAYTRGKCLTAPTLVTYAFKRRSGEARIGITTGKKLGNAVTRNRARRVIRAAWREVCPEVSGAADIVFVARARTAPANSRDVAGVMRNQLRACGLIGENE